MYKSRQNNEITDTRFCTQWKLHLAMFCGLRKRENDSETDGDTQGERRKEKEETEMQGESQQQPDGV